MFQSFFAKNKIASSLSPDMKDKNDAAETVDDSNNKVPRHVIVKNNIKSIAEHSSIDGVQNILKSEYKVMKLIWTVSFILAISYSSYLVVQMVIDYFKYDVLINIHYIADYDMDFPAVAICDFNDPNRTLDDLLIDCQFNSMPCNKSYFGQVFSTTYGYCHTFNAYEANRAVLKSGSAGYSIGLSLELFAGVPSQMPVSKRATGLAVSVYNASSRPIFSEEPVRIRPGQETNLMISRKESRKLPSPFSECLVNVTDPLAFDSDEFRYTMNLSRVYRQDICVSSCAMKNKGEDLSERNVSECLSLCPKECTSIEFDIFSYFSLYPNDRYALDLQSKTPLLNDLSLADLKESLILLNINYQTMTTTIVEETPAMTFETLLGSLGGQLGLFLGMSFLSFMEIFEIVFILLWEYFFANSSCSKSNRLF